MPDEIDEMLDEMFDVEPDEMLIDGVEWHYYISDSEAFLTHCYRETLKEELTIPNNLGGFAVTTIENYSFSGCSGLTSITIPDSVTSIGMVVFENCSSLKYVRFNGNVSSSVKAKILDSVGKDCIIE